VKFHVRAMIAATAISHGTGRKLTAVYAHGAGGYVPVEVSVTEGAVAAYDRFSQSHLNGTIPDLYHHGEQAHIHLQPEEGGRYRGYDHSSSGHFELIVTGESARLYDHAEGEWFSFSAAGAAPLNPEASRT
jgi:hypothetical protein